MLVEPRRAAKERTMRKLMLAAVLSVAGLCSLPFVLAEERVQQGGGQCFATCASEHGMCVAACQGDGRCQGQCGAAHGRCVARCG